MQPTPSRAYLRHLTLGFALLMLLAAALAVAVDPYYVFDSPRITGFNRLKPRSVNQGAKSPSCTRPPASAGAP